MTWIGRGAAAVALALSLMLFAPQALAGWAEVVPGALNVDPAQPAYAFPSITSFGGRPAVAWSETDGTSGGCCGQIRVAVLDPDGAWVQIGTDDPTGPSAINFDREANAVDPRLTVVGGALHVTWGETPTDVGAMSRVFVARLNGTGTQWSLVGGGAAAAGGARTPHVADVGGEVWLAYVLPGGEGNLHVAYFSALSQTWQPGGDVPATTATQPSLGYIGGRLWLTWWSIENPGDHRYVRVARYDSVAAVWRRSNNGEPLNHDLAAEYVGRPRIVGRNSIPWISWSESSTGQPEQQRVTRLGADGESWNEVVGGHSPINHDLARHGGQGDIAVICNRIWTVWHEFTTAANSIFNVHASRLDGAGLGFDEIGGGPVAGDDSRSGFNSSLAEVGEIPYVAFTELDEAGVAQIRVSRLEPEFVDAEVTTTDTGAILTASLKSYELEYGVGFLVSGPNGFSLTTGLTTTAGEFDSVTKHAAGLTPGTTYSYRPFVLAGVQNPRVLGPVGTFTTTGTPPPPPGTPPPPPDTVRPETTILSGPAASTTRRAATFRFKSNEAGSTFMCRLDRAPWSSCRSPRTYRDLRRGRHIFRVRAKDAAQNVDLTPATRSWTIR